MHTLKRHSAVLSALLAALCACSSDPNDSLSASRYRGTGESSGSGLGTGNANGASAQAGGSAFVVGTGPSGPSLGSESCASTMVTAGRKQPIVTLVIDGSGSMCADFGGATRWQALRSALLDADGIVTRLQGVVSFGMALYDGPLDVVGGLLGGLGGMGTGGPGAGGSAGPQCALMGAMNAMGKACPNTIEVPPALNNAMAIANVYPMTELGGSTPTHKVMAQVVDHLTEQMNVPDATLQPQYIVLATDGQPNELCANPSGVDPQAEVIAQVARAADAGIKTFVISLAGADAALMDHLVAVAQAGQTNSPPFSPMSKQDLVSSLGQIIGGAVGCEVYLNGKVALGQECGGRVVVNGVELPCDDPNGWALRDESTVILQGSACQSFQNDPYSILDADFPCGVFNPS